MIPDFISLTDRRTNVTVLINATMITSIADNRTSTSYTEDFHYTTIRCGSDAHEVKEDLGTIIRKLTDIKFHYAKL